MCALRRTYSPLLLALVIVVAGAVPGCQVKPQIRLAANPWLGSVLGAQVAALVLSEAMGHPIAIVEVDESAQWEALARGELDASLEVWPSGHQREIIALLGKEGGVESLGLLGVVGRIGWYVPSFLLEDHPELATWEGLRDPALAALFQTPMSGGKGRFLAGDPTWVQYDRQIITNLGLDLEVVHAGSEATLMEVVQEAVSQRRPILFYFWFPHLLHASLPLSEVRLPPYSDQCYANIPSGGVDCAYPPDVLFKIAWPGLRRKAPGAHRFLKSFNLSDQDQLFMMALVAQGKSPEQAARVWVAENRARWQAWIPMH